MLKLLPLLAAALVFTCVASAKDLRRPSFEGHIEVEEGITVYAKVQRGARGAPVFVLLNGLTQDIDHWDTVVPFLEKQGATIVRLDLAFQGRSLIERVSKHSTLTRPIVKPLAWFNSWFGQSPVLPMTTVETQAKYVITALDKLGFEDPVTLLGLSYGGGEALQIAADFPERVKAAILAAPYVFPLPEQDKILREGVEAVKLWFPQWRTVSDEVIYDVLLRGLVVTTYPQVEPQILKWSPPYQAFGAAELVRGIRHLKYQELLARLRVPVHMVVAGEEKYLPKDKLEEFWANVPGELRGSHLEVIGSEHKINEAVGPLLAAWAWQLAVDQQYLENPGRFLASPQTGLAREIDGDRVVQLERVLGCNGRLTPVPIAAAAPKMERGSIENLINASNAMFGSARR